jgi:glutamate-1-semialdehyde 2,1-aminomutase
MEKVAPLGDVYQAGTLSGNPIAVRAGIYVLKYLRKNKNLYQLMDKRVDELKKNITEIAKRLKIPYRINSITGMFTGFFSDGDVYDYETAYTASRVMYEKFFKLMLEEGIFFAPSPFEASFITLSHREKEITKTVEAYEKVFKRLKTLS